MTNKSKESTLTIADKQSDASIDVSKVSKVKASKKGKPTAKVNMYTPVPTKFVIPWVPNTQERTPLYNALSLEELKKVEPQTLFDIATSFSQDVMFQDLFERKKQEGKSYSLKKIGKMMKVPLKSIVTSWHSNREISKLHVKNILENYREDLQVMPFLVDNGDGTYSIFDSQHGTITFTLNSIFDMYDCSVDLDKYMVDAYVISSNHPGITGILAESRNGKGQKRWSRFDYHRSHVANARLYKSKDKEHVDALERQKIAEKYGLVVVSTNDKLTKRIGSLTHINGLYSYNYKQLDFTFKMHQRYWNNSRFDSAQYSIFGIMEEFFRQNSIPMTGQAFDEFMDNINAIVKTVFTSFVGLRKAAATAYKHYFIKVYKQKSQGNAPIGCELAILLKIYRRLGGNHITPFHSQHYVENVNGQYIDIVDCIATEFKNKINGYKPNAII